MYDMVLNIVFIHPVVLNLSLYIAPSGHPQDVRAESTSSTEITVMWNPVPDIERNGIITQYEVVFHSVFDDGISANVTMSNGSVEQSLPMTGLEEYVQYDITVRAYTVVGHGPFSPAVSNTTFEDSK